LTQPGFRLHYTRIFPSALLLPTPGYIVIRIVIIICAASVFPYPLHHSSLSVILEGYFPSVRIYYLRQKVQAVVCITGGVSVTVSGGYKISRIVIIVFYIGSVGFRYVITLPHRSNCTLCCFRFRQLLLLCFLLRHKCIADSFGHESLLPALLSPPNVPPGHN